MFELTNAVGNNRDNRPEDVFKIKDTLSDIGFFDFDSNPAEPHGIFTRELRDGIRNFQKDNGLRVDGILKPKGETESALHQKLAAENPVSNSPLGGFVFASEKQNEFDATGRRIRDQDRSLFEPMSLRFPNPQREFSEEAIKKKLQERIISNAAAAPAPEEESKSVEFDATGRMIRPQPDTAKVLQEKPDFSDQLEENEDKKERQENSLSVPEYKKAWFALEGGPRNWSDWTQSVQVDSMLTQTEKKVFLDVFAAEGGSFRSDGTTYGGVTQGTLNDLKKESQPIIQKLVKKHGANFKPFDLDIEDQKDFYKGYYDWIFRGAAKTYSNVSPNDLRSGSQMLDTIGDTDAAKAVADVIFREGSDLGVKLVQKSINKLLPASQKMSNFDGVLGTGSFEQLRDIVNDENKKRKFLETLGDFRDQERSGEKARNEYFRFRN